MDNNDLRVITLQNPTTKDFTYEYNHSITRTIRAGATIKMPWNPIGGLFKKHLIDFCCNENNENTGDPNIRAKWESKVVIDDSNGFGEEKISAVDALQRKIDILNNENTSNKIFVCEKCNIKILSLSEHNALNHPNIEEALPERTTLRPDLAQLNNQVLTNATKLNEPTVLEEAKIEEASVTQEPASAQPTREQLIAHARDVLKMNIEDPSTKKFLETADIEQIKTELLWGK